MHMHIYIYMPSSYEKSLGVGMKADGTMGDLATEIRTSAHVWCSHPECLNDPQVNHSKHY